MSYSSWRDAVRLSTFPLCRVCEHSEFMAAAAAATDFAPALLQLQCVFSFLARRRTIRAQADRHSTHSSACRSFFFFSDTIAVFSRQLSTAIKHVFFRNVCVMFTISRFKTCSRPKLKHLSLLNCFLSRQNALTTGAKHDLLGHAKPLCLDYRESGWIHSLQSPNA